MMPGIIAIVATLIGSIAVIVVPVAIFLTKANKYTTLPVSGVAVTGDGIPSDRLDAAINAFLEHWAENFNAGEADRLADFFSRKLTIEVRPARFKHAQDRTKTFSGLMATSTHVIIAATVWWVVFHELTHVSLRFLYGKGDSDHEANQISNLWTPAHTRIEQVLEIQFLAPRA